MSDCFLLFAESSIHVSNFILRDKIDWNLPHHLPNLFVPSHTKRLSILYVQPFTKVNETFGKGKTREDRF